MTAIVTLQQAKAWLRFPTPTQPHPDDDVVQQIIDAVTEMIESRVGPCAPQSFTERHDGGLSTIFLNRCPVLTVDSIQENAGFITYDLAFQDIEAPVVSSSGSAGGGVASSVWSYSLDVPMTGMVTARSVGNSVRCFAPGVRNVEVIYTAGRSPMPAALILAAQELVAHTYQNALQRGISAAGTFIGYDATTGQAWSRDDSGDGGMSYWVGIPYRVLAYLESEQIKLPVIA